MTARSRRLPRARFSVVVEGTAQYTGPYDVAEVEYRKAVEKFGRKSVRFVAAKQTKGG